MENPRTDAARSHDDKDIIEEASDEGAVSFGGSSGGNLQRDIGSRAEAKAPQRGEEIERVRDKDKPEEADLPRYNER
jgi:hypothetical protein